MTLYSVYFVLLSVFLLNVGSYFDAAFTAVGIGVGMRTVVIQAATLVVLGLIVATRRPDRGAWRELLTVVGVWTPLLIYAALRVESGDAYSETKFAKLFAISFLCTVTVTATYLCDPRSFTRLLPVVVIVFSILLGAEALLHPQQFKYRTVIDRMTIEGMNPIWLARSFALAGVCLFLLPAGSNAVKLLGLALVVAGILPTGSRGPLISLLVVLTLWFAFRSDGTGLRLAIATVCAGVMAVSVLLFAGDRIETAANSYFSRGQNQGFIEESGRPMLFNRAMNDILSTPVLGVGLGKFGESAIRGSKIYSRNSSNLGAYPHNIILELLSELGVLGLMAALVAMRPGKWLLDLKNPYFYPFLFALLCSMSSGDINANTGLFIFGALARLTSRYPVKAEALMDFEAPELEAAT